MTRVALFPLCGWSDPDDDDDATPIPLVGDLPAPLTITIAGTALANAVCAVCPPGSDIGDFYFSDTVGPFTEPCVMEAVTVPLAGRYRALAYLTAGEAGASYGIGTGDATTPQTLVHLDSTGETPVLTDLGEFSATADLTLSLFLVSGHAWCMGLIIVPVDVSCVSAWNLPSVSSLVFSYNANTHLSYVIGNGITAPLDMANLLVVTDPAGSEYTVSISYTPSLYGWSS